MSQRIFHILIAEDMETTVDLMKYYLNKEFSNLDISVVGTPDPTLSDKELHTKNKHLLSCRYDLAIVDFNMPYPFFEISDSYKNAGEYVIDTLVKKNPDILIVIRTVSPDPIEISSAINKVERYRCQYIRKENLDNPDEFQKLIAVVKNQLDWIKKESPDRIQAGRLEYFHKYDADLAYEYGPDNYRSYRDDDIYLDKQLIADELTTRQKYVLYLYLKNLNLPLFDRKIIQSLQTNYAVDFLDSASVSKRMRESILNKLLPLFDKAGLELICERNPSKRTLVIKDNVD